VARVSRRATGPRPRPSRAAGSASRHVRGRVARGRPVRTYQARQYEQTARQRLQRFRRAPLLAVAITGLILLFWFTNTAPLEALGQEVAQVEQQPAAPQPIPDPATAVEEAAGTVRDLVLGAYAMIPKIIVALVIMVIAWILTRIARGIFRRMTPNWSRADAAGALSGVIIFLIALGAALSVIAGDARALVGSVGLAGLALSWALQTPIESFTGWLLNSFQNYYRVGDRIEVGEVFGDVYRIDILTTTVWEAGGPGKPVQGAQPTGALITFPNSDVLRANIINYTREFSQVWDEVTFNIAAESELAYAARFIEDVARRVVGPAMAMQAAEYQRLLERKGLAFDVAVSPTVFISLADAWVNMTVRYLVDARARRRWASELVMAVSTEVASPEHRGRVILATPRTQVQLVDHEGRPRDLPGA
jgi:small conductance mechanosensitive channel